MWDKYLIEQSRAAVFECIWYRVVEHSPNGYTHNIPTPKTQGTLCVWGGEKNC